MNNPARQLVLMGLRGSGKTTVGRLVADRTGRVFIDLDDIVAQRLACSSVAEAWRSHGQARFRIEETAALQDVLGNPATALALGGGTPIAPGAADLLRAATKAGSACVVYLKASPGVLRDRLGATDIGARPSITGAQPLDEIEAVFNQRNSLYTSTASFTIDAAERADVVADRIIALMEQA